MTPRPKIQLRKRVERVELIPHPDWVEGKGRVRGAQGPMTSQTSEGEDDLGEKQGKGAAEEKPAEEKKPTARAKRRQRENERRVNDRKELEQVKEEVEQLRQENSQLNQYRQTAKPLIEGYKRATEEYNHRGQ